LVGVRSTSATNCRRHKSIKMSRNQVFALLRKEMLIAWREPGPLIAGTLSPLFIMFILVVLNLSLGESQGSMFSVSNQPSNHFPTSHYFIVMQVVKLR
jgi:hypothetical protein